MGSEALCANFSICQLEGGLAPQALIAEAQPFENQEDASDRYKEYSTLTFYGG